MQNLTAALNFVGEMFFLVLIHPLELVLGLIFHFSLDILGLNAGLSIVLLSLVVNTILIPLYFWGDRIQAKEQKAQASFQHKKEEFQRVFKGSEYHMALHTLYRQHNYHPIYALRSSVGFLIQVPFFLAAYHYLKSLALLQGASWGPLLSLGHPDALLFWGGQSFNLLPILMTLANLLSSYIYTLGKPKVGTAQLWIIALLFLVLLYNSPAGLLIYWTTSNIYSLGKNLLDAQRRVKLGGLLRADLLSLGRKIRKLPYYQLSSALLLALGLMYFARFKYLDSIDPAAQASLAFGRQLWVALVLLQLLHMLWQQRSTLISGAALQAKLRSIPWRLYPYLVLLLLSFDFSGHIRSRFGELSGYLLQTALLGIPVIFEALFLLGRSRVAQVIQALAPKEQRAHYLWTLLLLLGLAQFFPSALLHSSPSNQPELIPLLAYLLLPALLVLALSVYFAGRRWARNTLPLLAFLAINSLLNGFVFLKDYGSMTNWLFDFTHKLEVSPLDFLLGVSSPLLAYFLLRYIYSKAERYLGLMRLAASTLLGISLVYNISLLQTYQQLQASEQSSAELAQKLDSSNDSAVFHFAKPEITGKEKPNVLIVMLDRFIGPYVDEIIKQEPDLASKLEGFVWYEQALSYGDYTITGVPSLVGGHEYSPARIQEIPGSLREKVNQAYLVLPKLFQKAGYAPLVIDPSWSNFNWRGDLTMFQKEGITAKRLTGIQRAKWLAKAGTESITPLQQVPVLAIQSLLRISPIPLRLVIYDEGKWLKVYPSSGARKDFITLVDAWGGLSQLSNLSSSEAKEPSYTLYINNTTHDTLKMGYTPNDPEYKFQPVLEPSKDYPPELLAKFKNAESIQHFYSDWAALLQLAKLFRWMKKEGVYDNSLIAIVSDHGRGVHIPQADYEDGDYFPYFESLFMIKEPYSSGPLASKPEERRISGDLPYILTRYLPQSQQRNPFTDKEFSLAPQDGTLRVFSTNFDPQQQNPDSFKILREFAVEGDIYQRSSWREIPLP